MFGVSYPRRLIPLILNQYPRNTVDAPRILPKASFLPANATAKTLAPQYHSTALASATFWAYWRQGSEGDIQRLFRVQILATRLARRSEFWDCPFPDCSVSELRMGIGRITYDMPMLHQLCRLPVSEPTKRPEFCRTRWLADRGRSRYIPSSLQPHCPDICDNLLEHIKERMH